jgi:hypothetical protein
MGWKRGVYRIFATRYNSQGHSGAHPQVRPRHVLAVTGATIAILMVVILAEIVLGTALTNLLLLGLLVVVPFVIMMGNPNLSPKNNHRWVVILRRADSGQRAYRLLAALGRSIYGVHIVQSPGKLTDQNFHAVADKMAYMINDTLGIPLYQGYVLKRYGSLIIAEFTNPPSNLDGGTIVFEFPSQDLRLFRKGLSYQEIIDHYTLLSMQMPLLSEIANEYRH